MTAGKLLVSCVCSIATKTQNKVLNRVKFPKERLNLRLIQFQCRVSKLFFFFGLNPDDNDR